MGRALGVCDRCGANAVFDVEGRHVVCAACLPLAVGHLMENHNLPVIDVEPLPSEDSRDAIAVAAVGWAAA